MGKIRCLIFNTETQCDIVERNVQINDEQLHVGMSTFDMIHPPAFSDSFGIQYRIYDRSNPYAIIPIRSEDDLKKYEIEGKEHSSFTKKEIENMKKIIGENETPRLSIKLVKEIIKSGYKPVYRGMKIYSFRKLQEEKWFGKVFAHTPEVNHKLFNNTHGKNTFGDSESRKGMLIAFGGFLFGVIFVLMITLPIITFLGAN